MVRFRCMRCHGACMEPAIAGRTLHGGWSPPAALCMYETDLETDLGDAPTGPFAAGVPTPGVDPSPAMMDACSPVDDACNRAGEASTPVGEACNRAGEAPTPVGEACNRAGEAPTPVGEACNRAGEASTPVGDACNRAGEASNPVGDARMPVGNASPEAVSAIRTMLEGGRNGPDGRNRAIGGRWRHPVGFRSGEQRGSGGA